MYGIFTYISHKNQPNVGEHTIHGSLGNYITYIKTQLLIPTDHLTTSTALPHCSVARCRTLPRWRETPWTMMPAAPNASLRCQRRARALSSKRSKNEKTGSCDQLLVVEPMKNCPFIRRESQVNQAIMEDSGDSGAIKNSVRESRVVTLAPSVDGLFLQSKYPMNQGLQGSCPPLHIKKEYKRFNLDLTLGFQAPSKQLVLI